MRFIIFAIIPLIVIALLSVILGSEIASIEIEYLKYNAIDRDTSSQTIIFDLDAVQFGMVFLIAISTGVVFAGIMVLGTGLQDSSVRTIIMIVLYTGVWSILSVLSIDLLFLNQVIGGIIYAFLCIIYIIGVAMKISDG